ncbi:MAG: hypothetical protein CVU11_12220 [Bacteroidetes bacterium HGW-Bacteroidetes-6]|jgi:hypothetical protein|nr:MAG: hypothetical protein CVU11_12220 [Bacteroidetes bacterium HGW-Bacteroidetes-6]
MNKMLFHLFPRMAIVQRITLFLILVAGGIGAQFFLQMFVPGCFLVLAGSVLMFTKGIDKRIFPGRYNQNADWKKSTREQVESIVKMDRKLKIWDRSAFEISSCLGIFVFILILVFSLYLFIIGDDSYRKELSYIGGNILMLFIPHFFSGLKKYDTSNKVVIYAKECLKASDIIHEQKPDAEISYLTLLAPAKKIDATFPKEVKLKIMVPNAPDDFMGIYGQLSLNSVGSNIYPYFYTVIIYKEGAKLQNKAKGLKRLYQAVIVEFTSEAGVEVMVIRQATTKTSGYNTNTKAVIKIIEETLNIYKQLSCK